MVKETSNYINTERRGESSIAPLFQSPACKKRGYNNDKVHYIVVLCKFLLFFQTVKKLTNILIPARESTVNFLFHVNPIFLQNTMFKIASL